MAEPQYVLGISANESPEASVWVFKDGKLEGEFGPVTLGDFNPRNAPSEDRISLPVVIVNSLIKKIEALGFKVRQNLKGWAIDCIGISMPGNIDTKNHVVQNIARMLYPPHFKHGSNWQEYVRKTNIKDECNLKLPLHINNDVTCIARAESHLLGDIYKYFVFVYVDTGTNIGVLIDGKPLQSALHPELGHLRARSESLPEKWKFSDEKDNFCGVSHNGCFESILAKAAIEQRVSLKKVLQGDISVAAEREYIARCIAEICEIALLAYAPQKIVVGGYVNDWLLHLVKQIFSFNMKGYPIYSERELPDFIQLSPHQPNTIASLGAALLAHQHFGSILR